PSRFLDARPGNDGANEPATSRPGLCAASALRVAGSSGPGVRRRSGRSGFTLIELLVAAGITAVLAGFIAVMVRNVSVIWSRSSQRLATDAQARVVLDQLQLDL